MKEAWRRDELRVETGMICKLVWGWKLYFLSLQIPIGQIEWDGIGLYIYIEREIFTHTHTPACIYIHIYVDIHTYIWRYISRDYQRKAYEEHCWSPEELLERRCICSTNSSWKILNSNGEVYGLLSWKKNTNKHWGFWPFWGVNAGNTIHCHVQNCNFYHNFHVWAGTSAVFAVLW